MSESNALHGRCDYFALQAPDAEQQLESLLRVVLQPVWSRRATATSARKAIFMECVETTVGQRFWNWRLPKASRVLKTDFMHYFVFVFGTYFLCVGITMLVLRTGFGLGGIEALVCGMIFAPCAGIVILVSARLARMLFRRKTRGDDRQDQEGGTRRNSR